MSGAPAVFNIGHNTGFATAASGSLSFGTTGATLTDTTVILAIGSAQTNTTPNTVSTVVASGTSTLVWTKYTAKNFIAAHDSFITNPCYANLEIWIARGTIHSSGDTVTVTFGANVDHCTLTAVYVGTDGVTNKQNTDTVHPFDLNSSLPSVGTVTSPAGIVTTSPSTDTANVTVVAVTMTPSNQPPGSTTFGGAAADFSSNNNFSSGGTNWDIVGFDCKAFTAQQTALAVDAGSSLTNQMMVTFALTADVQNGPVNNSRTTVAVIQ
jgi:hypothetical protein